MDVALGILVVVVLAGLTVLAFTHKQLFPKVALPLYWASLLTLLAMAGEALGTRSAVRAMRPFIDPGKASEAQAVIATLGTPWWALLGAFAVAAYLFLLLFLPMILGTHKKT
ncbi:MAG: hypothetical protein AAF967_02180 [Pseudomonadota bacterium]